jgi:hypothetical protein
MSSYYQYNAHQHPTSSIAQPVPSSHHSGRGRRAPRLSQNPHKQQFRNVRKDEEAAAVVNYRQRFEFSRSFDLEDDLEFCPTLLSEVDLVSIHSSSSDRSSLSSGSPESSPQSAQVVPESTFTLNSNSNPYIPSGFQNQAISLKLHQPAATRIRNAIPIVNPTTGISMSSPPQSVSPARMQQTVGRRW